MPDPCATYSYGLRSDTAYSIYRELYDVFKVRPADIDRGYEEINYERPGLPNEVKGAFDCNVDQKELFDFVFNNAEKYQELIKKSTSKEVAWVITDPKARKKIEAAIETLNDILDSADIEKNSADHSLAMATGLFYFVLMPSEKYLSKIPDPQKNAILKEFRELSQGPLKQWGEYLTDRGGLNVWFMRRSPSGELTAQESLDLDKGSYSEKLKMIYGVFRMAGLDTVLVRSYSDPSKKYKKTNYDNSEPDIMYVGIKDGDGAYLFEPYYGMSHTKEDTKYFYLNPKMVFTQHLLWTASVVLRFGQNKTAENLYKQALDIDPVSLADSAYMGLSKIAQVMGDRKAMENYVELAEKANPANSNVCSRWSDIYVLYGDDYRDGFNSCMDRFMRSKGDKVDSIRKIQDAIRIYYDNGDLSKFIEILEGIDPNVIDKNWIHKDLAMVYILKGDFKKAKKSLDRASRDDHFISNEHLSHLLIYSYIYYHEGELEKALKTLEKVWGRQKDFQTIALMCSILVKLGRRDEAGRVLEDSFRAIKIGMLKEWTGSDANDVLKGDFNVRFFSDVVMMDPTVGKNFINIFMSVCDELLKAGLDKNAEVVAEFISKYSPSAYPYLSEMAKKNGDDERAKEYWRLFQEYVVTHKEGQVKDK